MNNRKSFFVPVLFGIAAFSLTGCLSTQLKSMGTYPMPIAHQPRLAPDSKEAEKVISVDGVGLFNESWTNTEQIYGGGAYVSGIYRLPGELSPLFASVSVGGFGGHVNFTCDEKKDCDKGYLDWLKSHEGHSDQSFWGIQERAFVGFEYNTPANIFFGLGGGAFVYQSGGDFDKARKKLDKKFPKIDRKGGHIDAFLLGSAWLGYHIGQNGKYGAVSLDISTSDAFSDDNTVSLPINLGYFHPTGFHGGVGFTGSGIDAFFGKSFQF